MKNTRKNIYVFCLLLLMVACGVGGCVRYSIPHTRARRTNNLILPRVTVSSESIVIDDTELKHSVDYNQYTDQIADGINHFFADNMFKEDRFEIKNISVFLTERISPGFQPAFLSIVSTPIIVPFSLIPTRYSVLYEIEYTLIDNNGSLVNQGFIEGQTKASARGWSFFRYAFRSKMIKGMRATVIKSIPIEIENDIVRFVRRFNSELNTVKNT